MSLWTNPLTDLEILKNGGKILGLNLNLNEVTKQIRYKGTILFSMSNGRSFIAVDDKVDFVTFHENFPGIS